MAFLSAIALAQGDIVGAKARLREGLMRAGQEAFDEPLATVRPMLSAQEFAQVWVAGEQMTMAKAVALALTETTDNPSTDDVPQVSAAPPL